MQQQYSKQAVQKCQVFHLKCPCALLSVAQGYHELYELQRSRLEAQLLQMTEERDYWSQVTFCLAFKVCEPRCSFFFQLDSLRVNVM